MKQAAVQPEDLAGQLDLDLDTFEVVATLSEEHGHRVWRVVVQGEYRVLKWLPETNPSRREIEGYLLLGDLGVPTLPLHGHANQALLLPDLTHDSDWRLASEEDVSRADVGEAVGVWYSQFHGAGEQMIAEARTPDWLRGETEDVTPESILQTAGLLELESEPVWTAAAECVELLKAAAAHLSKTLNYNDFHWTNLAVSREAKPGLRAVVFDYDLLGTGMRYSDYRNVTGSLSGAAVAAFAATYGEVDPREQVLDRPGGHAVQAGCCIGNAPLPEMGRGVQVARREWRADGVPEGSHGPGPSDRL